VFSRSVAYLLVSRRVCLSAKTSLVGSLALYAVYVGSYLVASLVPSLAWPLVLFGAAVGGVGAGVLWTAQGTYFKLNARLYAEALGESDEKASSFFSATFAALYLGLEVFLKLGGSLVALYTPGDSGRLLILAAYPTVAVAATLALALLVADLQRPLGHEGRGRSEPGRLSRGPKRDDDSFAAAGGGSKATAAVRLLLTNRKCLLLLPTNAAFGLASAFITAYVNGSVVSPVREGDDDAALLSEERHESRVLLYSSLAVTVAALLALPGLGFHWLKQKAGTEMPMLVGAACFVGVAAMQLANPNPKDLRQLLWLLYAVYGAGRSVWESNVKALFADYFDESESEGAFANIILQSGLATAAAFFAFPALSPAAKAWLVASVSLAGALGFMAADRLHKREVRRDPRRDLLAGPLLSPRSGQQSGGQGGGQQSGGPGEKASAPAGGSPGMDPESDYRTVSEDIS